MAAELTFPPAARAALPPMPERPLDVVMKALHAFDAETRKNTGVLEAIEKRLSAEVAAVGIAPDKALVALGIKDRGGPDEWRRLSKLNDATIMALRRVDQDTVTLRTAARTRTTAAATRIRTERQQPTDMHAITEANKIEREAVSAILRLVRTIDERAHTAVNTAMATVACERHMREIAAGKNAEQIASIERHLQSMLVMQSRPHTLIELSSRLMGDWQAPERTAQDMDKAIENEAARKVDSAQAPVTATRPIVDAIRTLLDAAAVAHELDPYLRHEASLVSQMTTARARLDAEITEDGEGSRDAYDRLRTLNLQLETAHGVANEQREHSAVQMAELINKLLGGFATCVTETAGAAAPGDVSVLVVATMERVCGALTTAPTGDIQSTVALAMQTVTDVVAGNAPPPPPLPPSRGSATVNIRMPTAADDPLAALQ